MSVDVARAEADGLTVEHAGKTFAFCRTGCLRAFQSDPDTYAEQAMAAATSSVDSKALPVIDEGMRRWYESCSCCLSDAYPEIKAALDAEYAAAGTATVQAGICEVEETREVVVR
jgi:YHS domain-containing protein